MVSLLNRGENSPSFYRVNRYDNHSYSYEGFTFVTVSTLFSREVVIRRIVLRSYLGQREKVQRELRKRGNILQKLYVTP